MDPAESEPTQEQMKNLAETFAQRWLDIANIRIEIVHNRLSNIFQSETPVTLDMVASEYREKLIAESMAYLDALRKKFSGSFSDFQSAVLHSFEGITVSQETSDQNIKSARVNHLMGYFNSFCNNYGHKITDPPFSTKLQLAVLTVFENPQALIKTQEQYFP